MQNHIDIATVAAHSPASMNHLVTSTDDNYTLTPGINTAIAYCMVQNISQPILFARMWSIRKIQKIIVGMWW